MFESPEHLAPGTRAVNRGEKWLIRRVDPSTDGGWVLTCDGISDLVHGQSARFLRALEDQCFGDQVVKLKSAEDPS